MAKTPVVAVPGDKPPKAQFVLLALVVGAIVANMNLGIANVALPSIGRDLGATQSQLTAVANAFALALAASVLYLGAIGDRYGRKLLFVAGGILTIPTCFLAAFAPNVEILIGARFLSGFAAALLFPTTLSLISALFKGGAQVRAIALWSGLGSSVAAVGPLLGGWCLEYFWWGSVFLITVPLAVAALVVGVIVLPWRAGEEAKSVDHLGGVLSIVMVASIVLAIESISRGFNLELGILGVTAIISGILFALVELRSKQPLVDLKLARRNTFWVAAVAGAITFGSLIGAMFIGQQFTQNVLGYEPIVAAAVVLPSAAGMAIFGQISGKLVLKLGGRTTFLAGLLVVSLAFALMLLTWTTGAAMGWVLLAYAVVGSGVGLCVTPASHALMSSLPVSRAGMGSAFLDLTRDFGGSLMQAVMGVLLAVAYSGYFAKAFATLSPAQAQELGSDAAQRIASSYAGAQQVAESFPQADAQQLVAAANQAFVEGKTAAYSVGLVMALIAFALVLWKYPRKAAESEVFASVAAADRAHLAPNV